MYKSGDNAYFTSVDNFQTIEPIISQYPSIICLARSW